MPRLHRRRRGLRQDVDRVRGQRRHARGPEAHARQHAAQHRGQGRGRRPDPGRSARGHGDRRNARPRYGSYPGWHAMIELSMTFVGEAVGTNGQRQAMYIERVPGLAEVILSNYEFGADDLMMVFSASGLSAVPVEMARGARRRGMKVIAVTSVAQSMSAEPDPVIGARLLDEADLVIDLCTPLADA